MKQNGNAFNRQPNTCTQPDLFVSFAREKDSVQTLQGDAKTIIQQCYPETEFLLNKIEALGLPVIVNGPERQLRLAMMLVGVQGGFITPTTPKYETLVAFIIKHMPERSNQDFSRGLMLVLKENYQFSIVAYHFYHWLAYRKGLPGYQAKALKLYDIFMKKYHGQLAPKFLEQLDFDETSQLRMAIRRDREALQFIRQMLHEVYIPTNNAKLVDKGTAQA